MSDNCFFCDLKGDKYIFSNDLTFVVEDGFPLSVGHCLIIPKRHFASLFESTAEERAALWEHLEQAKQYILSKYQPDGFNIGVNDGQAAGQTVKHLHIHLIPRYFGDTDDPRGGVRWIMPAKAPYWENNEDA